MRAAVVALALGVAVQAAPPTRLVWDHEGYAALPDAAADAKKNGRRLLVGLSGSPT